MIFVFFKAKWVALHDNNVLIESNVFSKDTKTYNLKVDLYISVYAKACFQHILHVFQV